MLNMLCNEKNIIEYSNKKIDECYYVSIEERESLKKEIKRILTDRFNYTDILEKSEAVNSLLTAAIEQWEFSEKTKKEEVKKIERINETELEKLDKIYDILEEIKDLLKNR